MAGGTCLPHIYHTVDELLLVTDVTLLKNLGVRTMAYVKNNCAYGLQIKDHNVEITNNYIALDSNKFVLNDLKFYLILGVLYTVDKKPSIYISTVKQLQDMNNLIVYHYQLLAARSISPHYENFTQKFLEYGNNKIKAEQS